MFGKHPDVEHCIILSILLAKELNKELQEYRTLGPQGKLHNINTYIMRTPQRIQRFKKMSNDLMPHRDQAVRWNAWYTMIDWSLTKIKPAIQNFVSEESELEEDRLTANDWKVLAQMRDFLKSFYEVTKFTEGREANIDRVIPALDFLLHKFEMEIRKYEPDSFMALSLKAGSLKLRKYWKLITERAPIYIAAVVLDPSRKWDYFSRWDEFERDRAKESFQNLWNKYNNPSNTATGLIVTDESADASELGDWMAATMPVIAHGDELQQYLLEPRTGKPENILLWWNGHRERFPMLTRLAMYVYSTPSMSAEPERVFSGAKHTISHERALLEPTTIEALECCKSMLRIGAFTDVEINAAMAMELEEIPTEGVIVLSSTKSIRVESDGINSRSLAAEESIAEVSVRVCD